MFDYSRPFLPFRLASPRILCYTVPIGATPEARQKRLRIFPESEGRPTIHPVTENKIRAVPAYVFRTTALLCSTGSLMQTFLGTLGFPERSIYLHASAVQAVSVLTILLGSRFADRGNLIRRTALVQLPGGLLFLGYLPLCIARNTSAEAYLWLLLISVMQSAAMALHTVCEYKTPYCLFRREEYGSVLALCGLLSSAASFGAGALMSLLSLRFPYPTLMKFAFCFSAVLLLLAGLLQGGQKSLTEPEGKSPEPERKNRIPLSAIFRHESFSRLFTANLTRGFANGTTTVLAAAALSRGYDESVTAAMVSAASAAMLLACGLFGLTARRIPPRITIAAGSLCFLVLPFLLVREKPILFLILYGILLFGRTLIDYAVPASLLYVVPAEIAGTYNAWRMILHNGGTLLATAAAGFLPLPMLLALSALCQLYSGWRYLRVGFMKRT